MSSSNAEDKPRRARISRPREAAALSEVEMMENPSLDVKGLERRMTQHLFDLQYWRERKARF